MGGKWVAAERQLLFRSCSALGFLDQGDGTFSLSSEVIPPLATCPWASGQSAHNHLLYSSLYQLCDSWAHRGEVNGQKPEPTPALLHWKLLAIKPCLLVPPTDNTSGQRRLYLPFSALRVWV